MKQKYPDVYILYNKPALLNGRIHWQGNCVGSACDNLRWGIASNQPWDQYYQISCVNEKNEETQKTEPMGPVSFFNWAEPRIRLAADGEKACPDKQKVKIYRRNGASGTFEPLTNVRAFDGLQAYNYVDAVFTDTEYPKSTAAGTSTLITDQSIRDAVAEGLKTADLSQVTLPGLGSYSGDLLSGLSLESMCAQTNDAAVKKALGCP